MRHLARSWPSLLALAGAWALLAGPARAQEEPPPPPAPLEGRALDEEAPTGGSRDEEASAGSAPGEGSGDDEAPDELDPPGLRKPAAATDEAPAQRGKRGAPAPPGRPSASPGADADDAPPPPVDELPPPRAAPPAGEGTRPAEPSSSLPPPDSGFAIDALWTTGAGAAVGCGLLGIIPFLVSSAGFGFAGLLISSAIAEGGCGAIVLIIFAVAIGAIFGGIPAVLLGPLAALGALVGALVGAWAGDRGLLAPSLGALVGLVFGLAAPLVLVGSLVLTDTTLFARLGLGPESFLPAFLAVVAAGFGLAVLAGPAGVLGATTADLVFGGPPSPRGEDAVERRRDDGRRDDRRRDDRRRDRRRRDRRSATGLVETSVAMAY